MKTDEILQEVQKLGVGQRLLLVEAIWDSLSDDGAELPIPQWHRDKLDERSFDQGSARPWDEIRKEMGLR